MFCSIETSCPNLDAKWSLIVTSIVWARKGEGPENLEPQSHG